MARKAQLHFAKKLCQGSLATSYHVAWALTHLNKGKGSGVACVAWKDTITHSGTHRQHTCVYTGTHAHMRALASTQCVVFSNSHFADSCASWSWASRSGVEKPWLPGVAQEKYCMSETPKTKSSRGSVQEYYDLADLNPFFCAWIFQSKGHPTAGNLRMYQFC